MAERFKNRLYSSHSLNASPYAIPTSTSALLYTTSPLEEPLQSASVTSKSAARFLANSVPMGKKLSRLPSQHVLTSTATTINVRISSNSSSVASSSTSSNRVLTGLTVRARPRAQQQQQLQGAEYIEVDTEREVEDDSEIDLSSNSMNEVESIQIATPLTITTPGIHRMINGPLLVYDQPEQSECSIDLVQEQEQEQEPEYTLYYSQQPSHKYSQPSLHPQIFQIQPVATVQDPMFNSKMTPLALSTAFQVIQAWWLIYQPGLNPRKRSASASTRVLYARKPLSNATSAASAASSASASTSTLYLAGSSTSSLDAPLASQTPSPRPPPPTLPACLPPQPQPLYPLTPPLSPASFFMNHDERQVLLHIAGMTQRVQSLMRANKVVLSTALMYMMRFNSIALGNSAYYQDVNVVHLKNDIYYFWCAALTLADIYTNDNAFLASSWDWVCGVDRQPLIQAQRFMLQVISFDLSVPLADLQIIMSYLEDEATKQVDFDCLFVQLQHQVNQAQQFLPRKMTPTQRRLSNQGICSFEG
ncbi:hypothetical protein SeMB42_g04404 [Synchytrium endobioticum]|uniref:Uncharacterized protein n=1 Tax=Synchytrium endobioticum TaxID=286115 RepID=A0A507CYX3_9FUNG|nr:hypothetical protein SeLEV6574_g05705 [Synchytrium endobioticum]TPX44261.1 hypothetical protein SeMB42_g04404 [Synchytrium endobioticum]